MKPMELEELGFNNYFKGQEKSYPGKDLQPARISAVHRNSFLVHNGTSEIYAELAGKFFYQNDSPLNQPAVGDWVMISIFDENNLAIVHDILPRQSLIKRKDPGKKLDYQLIAANIDCAFIIQDLSTNFNLNRLERYLVMVGEGGVQPVILFSKSDLLSAAEIDQIVAGIDRLNDQYQWFIFSSLSGAGLEDIRRSLKPGYTYCLLGSSGVGKTTLLNILLGEKRFDVREVRSNDGKGRHTTTQRQLILLANGSLLIDTPGMKELGNISAEEGIGKTFDEILRLADQCRFSDCTHTSEQGCAVLEAIESGLIDRNRYDNYIKISKESAFYQMSYQDKRRKDKAFGRMYKQVMKNNRKK